LAADTWQEGGKERTKLFRGVKCGEEGESLGSKREPVARDRALLVLLNGEVEVSPSLPDHETIHLTSREKWSASE